MKHILLTIATLGLTQVAMADGFVCASEGLNVKVYNHTDPNQGTRTGAVMVVSSPDVGFGNKTIAKFTDANRTLESKNLIYTADVDLRYKDSGRKGELIGGTKLGQLDQIKLVVYFSYGAPVKDGDEVRARLRLVKRNGESSSIAMNCIRYLKLK